ncbi:MAG TPA: TIGR03668 family PPOX class F420-dependent oxidoreductase [Candidatus Kryptonia bacterium]|nr:TIGR03668 family PPOX class F420-dependent oxidoreductase [Candidatus Kryptonia bacterium]
MLLSDEAARFADAHRVARLATADAGGAPHVVPVCYARDGDCFYFVIDDKPKRGDPRRLKRLRNIAVNPQVALVVDDYDEDWTRLAFLLIHGEAELVGDEGDYAGALTRLRKRYQQYRAMPLSFASHPMVRIATRHVHLWRAGGAPSRVRSPTSKVQR